MTARVFLRLKTKGGLESDFAFSLSTGIAFEFGLSEFWFGWSLTTNH